jgi:hypothetical protein
VNLHRPAESRAARVRHSHVHRRGGARERDSHVGQVGVDHGRETPSRSSRHRKLKVKTEWTLTRN